MWILIVAISVLGTAFLSGIFGMAGGLILMAIYLALLSVPLAMMLHGVTQLASNGSRAFLLRGNFYWRGIGFYAIGAAVGIGILFAIGLTLDKAWASIALGLVPWAVFLIPKRDEKRSFHPDFTKPAHAVGCGFLVTGAHLTAGVSGPLLDVFFVTPKLTRHQIVGTKALTQSAAHAVKIIYFTTLASETASFGELPWLVYPVAIIAAFVGTALGRRVLDRIDDRSFLSWSRWLVLAIGTVSLVRGVMLLVERSA